VFICKTREDLLEKSRELFDKKILGNAGSRALLEQFQPGWELSYLVLTNGREWRTLPLAQDHKRLRDGDEGPNTGGMGTVAPLHIPTNLREQIETKIVAPSIALMEKKSMIFRGILFIGIMVTADGPMVLEYNTRFGDPETQVILPLIDGDVGKIFAELARGKLLPVSTREMSAACVIMAAEGYPDSPVKGVPLEGDLDFESTNNYFIHAGTKRQGDGRWVTNGGRVLGAMGFGSSTKEAIECAYKTAAKVTWTGMQMRSDIGSKVQ
jgi:phosphoribosylamine--glycine ligase